MWTSTTLQPPSSMRRPLHSAVQPNSGLPCSPILQDVAHINTPQKCVHHLWPGGVLRRSVQCDWGPILSNRCGDKWEVNYDQTHNFSGQVYAVGSLVTAGTTGRTRTRKRMRTLRKSGQGGSLHQPLYLPG